MPSTHHDLPAILQAVFSGYPLPRHGTHGMTHWARVLENGLRLCEAIGADTVAGTLGRTKIQNCHRNLSGHCCAHASNSRILEWLAARLKAD